MNPHCYEAKQKVNYLFSSNEILCKINRAQDNFVPFFSLKCLTFKGFSLILSQHFTLPTKNLSKTKP